MPHPYEKFKAPATIETGKSLADLFNKQTIKLIGESMVPVVPGFSTRRFARDAWGGLEALSLTQRASHIGDAMLAQLPAEPEATLASLGASLGPELSETENNGLKPFFYLPHSSCIAGFAATAFDAGMQANYELTKRFTAEFCVRSYLIEDQDRALACLVGWVNDSDPHVRRLISEGTRPRLPWGKQLKAFVKDPSPVLPLLEKLKDDPELYVRRSVANHLGDICKDHPGVVYKICRAWLKEVKAKGFDSVAAENRLWMIRHALRHPWKKQDPAAMKLRLQAGFIQRKTR